MFDETPDEPVPEIETISTVPSVSHAIYGSHLGLAAPSDTPLVVIAIMYNCKITVAANSTVSALALRRILLNTIRQPFAPRQEVFISRVVG
jgi:hypothetical protein